MLNRAARATILLNVVVWITGCGTDSISRSIAELQSPDVQTRREAARMLSQSASSEERVVMALANSAATDKDLEVRMLAIGGLSRIGKPAAASLPALKGALHDSDPHIPVQAALAIQKIEPNDRDSVPVLITAMRAGDGRVMLAVGALGKDAVWAVPTLVELLSHKTPQLRALVAQTLGRIGPPAAAAKAALERAGQDPNPAVRQSATEALEQVQATRR
jgi:HEAT repeat protein